MIKGAIFDMDGTLLDSMGAWRSVASRYVRGLGKTPEKRLDEHIRHKSMAEAAEYINRQHALQITPEEVMDGVIDAMAQFYEKEAECKPGIKDLLDRMITQGIPLCIATATDRPLVELALNRNGITGCFDAIFTCSEVGRGKAAPDIYEQALKFLRTPREETYVFEDACYAAVTAHRAGFPVVAIYDEQEPEQRRLKSVANFYVDDTTKLMDILPLL